MHNSSKHDSLMYNSSMYNSSMYTSPMYCLDNIKYDKTCYSMKQLKLIAELYNIDSNKKININQKKINLWKEIKLNLINCDNEICWMLLLDKEIKSPFKPSVNIGDELDADKIYKIAKSFENKKFYFYGIGPSDSYKTTLFNKYFSIKNSKSGAFILNLEEEGGRGTHWVLLFLENKNLFYYDSLGNPPTPNIYLFIDKISELLKIKSLKINKIKYQKENTNSCGYYVLKFLKNKLNKDKLNKDLKIDKNEFTTTM